MMPHPHWAGPADNDRKNNCSQLGQPHGTGAVHEWPCLAGWRHCCLNNKEELFFICKVCYIYTGVLWTHLDTPCSVTLPLSYTHITHASRACMHVYMHSHMCIYAHTGIHSVNYFKHHLGSKSNFPDNMFLALHQTKLKRKMKTPTSLIRKLLINELWVNFMMSFRVLYV